MAARASFANIVKNKFMRNSKNSLAIFSKIALALCLMTPLFSCSSNNNSISSNEDLGHSPDGSADYADSGSTGGIQSMSALKSSNQFVAGSKDIPLAAGLNKISDDGLDFDSASGSIIAITYKSSDDLQKMREFYIKTLPQLGWKSLKNDKPSVNLLRFKRDNEKLEIEFLNYNGDDLVKFFVETISR